MGVDASASTTDYHSGFLEKKGRTSGQFVRRFFRLSKTGLLLEYKVSAGQADMPTKQYSGITSAVKLEQFASSKSMGSMYNLKDKNAPRTARGGRFGLTLIYGDNEERRLYCKNEEDRDIWIQKINDVCGDGAYLAPDEVCAEAEHTFNTGPVGIGFILDNSKVLISRVTVDSQADLSGVRVGDVVTKVNGAPFDPPHETSDFEQYVNSFERPIKLTMQRYGTVTTHTFTEMPFGIECQVEGFCVKIVQVTDGHAAKEFGVKTNDIILEVNGRPFDLPNDAIAFSKQILNLELPLSLTFKSFKSFKPSKKELVSLESKLSQVSNGNDVKPTASETSPTAAPGAANNATTSTSGDVSSATTAQGRAASSTGTGPAATIPSPVSKVGFEVTALDPVIRDDYVAYPSKVLNKASGNHVICSHRYSEFLALRNALLQRDEIIERFPFPGKTLIRSNAMRPQVIDMRKEVLALWLDKVINLPQMQGVVELTTFISS